MGDAIFISNEVNRLFNTFKLKGLYLHKKKLCTDVIINEVTFRKQEYSGMKEFVYSFVDQPRYTKDISRLLKQRLEQSLPQTSHDSQNDSDIINTKESPQTDDVNSQTTDITSNTETNVEADDKLTFVYKNSVNYWMNSIGQYHRENDKPAIEYWNGTKEWYREGQRHRENDKPAIEWSDGTKMWYYKGQRHRDNDKPAVEYADGTKEWYYKGELHRDNDKPAIEYADGTKEWYFNGSLKRSETHTLNAGVITHENTNQETCERNKKVEIKETESMKKEMVSDHKPVETSGDDDKPTCVSKNSVKYWTNGKGQYHHDKDKPAVEWADGTKEWFYNGIRHRENDKPAVEWPDGKKEWFYNGKRHRVNDMPAIEHGNGKKEWFQYGQYHRDNDKPAIEFSHGRKEWWCHGQRHRDNDKPAVEYADGTKEWYYKGELHRDNDKPAIEYANGRKEWYFNGSLKRSETPTLNAGVITHENTNQETCEHNKKVEIKEADSLKKDTVSDHKPVETSIDEDKPTLINDIGTKFWRNSKGEFHRDNDKPAIEYTCGTRFWCYEGQYHRENDKPAVEWADGTKIWYNKGHMHRDNDKPAIEFANGSKEWYHNGMLHRDNDKPAIEYTNGRKVWCYNGLQHRENFLPAVETNNGENEWWYKGKHIDKHVIDEIHKRDKKIETLGNYVLHITQHTTHNNTILTFLISFYRKTTCKI